MSGPPGNSESYQAILADGPMMARFECYMDPQSSPHQLKKNNKKTSKNPVRVGPTPSDKIFWMARAFLLCSSVHVRYTYLER